MKHTSKILKVHMQIALITFMHAEKMKLTLYKSNF